jgi:hypothetical protein
MYFCKMNNKRGINIKQKVSYFLLAAFCMILANNVVFLHSHIAPDGTRYFHAHPYHKNNKIPGEQHKHTNIELIFLSQANHYLAPKNENVFLLCVPFSVLENNFHTISYKSGYYRLIYQRGPPPFHV